jgi:hypothetical protein
MTNYEGVEGQGIPIQHAFLNNLLLFSKPDIVRFPCAVSFKRIEVEVIVFVPGWEMGWNV